MRLVRTTGFRLQQDGHQVGHLFVELTPRFTKHQLQDLYETDFKGWRVPREFTYCWVHEIFVHHAKRGQGLGKSAIDQLRKQFRRPLVMALGPGLIDTKNPVTYRGLVEFYEHSGFRMVDTSTGRYALRVCK